MAAVLALGFAQALAQYPPPAGNILAQPANPNPLVNTQTQVFLTVQSQAGVPASNVGCIAAIGSQPGSGASVSPSQFVTDSAGKATLVVQTGDTAGQLHIGIDCGGLSANAVLLVGATAGGGPLPPNTGEGAQAASDSGIASVLVIGLVAVVAGGAGIGIARRKARTR